MMQTAIKTVIDGKPSQFAVNIYSEEDIEWVRQCFEAWYNFKEILKNDGKHSERSVNLHEAISETMYCILTHCGRYVKTKAIKEKLKDRSFDAFDILDKLRVQIKATQIDQDCTSFGPSSVYDKLIFMDFYNGGNVDGTVDIYDVPLQSIDSVVVSERDCVTFKERQAEGKRPRFSVKKEIIERRGLEPIYKKVKLW
jgi:hypothetical protein